MYDRMLSRADYVILICFMINTTDKNIVCKLVICKTTNNRKRKECHLISSLELKVRGFSCILILGDTRTGIYPSS